MKISNEAKIGMMVVIVGVMLAVITVKTGEIEFKKKGYFVKIQFHRIDGISTNTPVMLNGLEVGSVKNILIKETAEGTVMELKAFLEEKVKLREGTEAYVKSMGFLGEKYVGLTSGPGIAPYLQPGAVIEGKEPTDMGQLIEDGQQIAKEIKEVAKNLNERLKKNQEAIDRIIANLDTSMKNVTSITDNVDERLKVNQEHIDNILANLNVVSANLKSTSVNLDQFSADLKQNPWKLMYRPKKGQKIQ